MTARLGLTMGDPAGIGPEIVLAAARDLAPRVAAGEFALTVIGTRRCFEEISGDWALPPRSSPPRAKGRPGHACD